MLFDTYTKLVSEYPDDCVELFGNSLQSGDTTIWLAVDTEFYPSLLFKVKADRKRSDIELRSLSVKFSRNCTIETIGNKVISGSYTIVRLNENDPDVVRMLCRILEDSFSDKDLIYTNKVIAKKILQLSYFFRKLEDSKTDAIGLWGELHLISLFKNVDEAVRCWCRHKGAKYDFVLKNVVLEVKTTLRPQRVHRFSLEQLRPKGDFYVYVASLLVVEINSGKSVVELVDSISERITDKELRADFFTQCLVKGGKDIARNSMKLGVFPEEISISIFDAQNIPVPDIKSKPEIENVRFDVDLSDLKPLLENELDFILAFADG
jgi:hypothetical protein